MISKPLTEPINYKPIQIGRSELGGLSGFYDIQTVNQTDVSGFYDSQTVNRTDQL